MAPPPEPDRPSPVQAPAAAPDAAVTAPQGATPTADAEPMGGSQERPEPPRPALPASGPRWRTQAPLLRGRCRLVQTLAGAALITLFFLPWQGARSWELLPYLEGADYVRQFGLLVLGGMLASSGLLPVPPSFRAGTGLVSGVVFLGTGGTLLNLWQRLLAILVVVLLPASLLVRTQLQRARLPRWLGLMAVVALLSLYIVPRDQVVPFWVAVDLVSERRDEMARFIGTYLLLPLPLLGLATVALLGAEAAIIGELLAWLVLAWGPGALLVLAIDNTQVYMALAVLVSAASAAYGAAELLGRIIKTLERRKSE